MHPLIASTLASLPLQAGMARDLYRTKPVAKPASASMSSLGDAYVQRVKDVTGSDALPVKLNQNTPISLKKLIESGDEEGFKKALNMAQYASVAPQFKVDQPGNKADIYKSERAGSVININPNVDESYFAHELGHAASSQTAVGDMISRLRSDPKLQRALAIGGGLTALGAGIVTPGDDDLNAAILGTTALAAPTLIDEALATKNGLAIMEQAGLKASLGQRGRLAGGYLTYMAAPISSAILANTLGNQFDEDI